MELALVSCIKSKREQAETPAMLSARETPVTVKCTWGCTTKG